MKTITCIYNIYINEDNIYIVFYMLWIMVYCFVWCSISIYLFRFFLKLIIYIVFIYNKLWLTVFVMFDFIYLFRFFDINKFREYWLRYFYLNLFRDWCIKWISAYFFYVFHSIALTLRRYHNTKQALAQHKPNTTVISTTRV